MELQIWQQRCLDIDLRCNAPVDLAVRRRLGTDLDELESFRATQAFTTVQASQIFSEIPWRISIGGTHMQQA